MLTGREREILQLLADGMSNADVATQLFISQETVKSHVRHILAKLEADTRTHAVAIALREAIIDYERSSTEATRPPTRTAEPAEQVLAAEQDERRRIALFLHDGPVQSLSGVALMLDASLDLDQPRGARAGTGDPRPGARRTRTTVGELRDLSFNLEPVGAARPRFRGGGRGARAAPRPRAPDRGHARRRDDRHARRADAGGAVPDRARGARGGDPARAASRFEVSATTEAPGTLRLVIRDDAPTERRRRALEVLGERARTLGANLTLDHDEGGTTMILELRGHPVDDD